MFAPEPRHQAEQKTEYDLEIHGVLPGCYQLEKERKKKNQSYIQANFISTQSAFVQWSLKRRKAKRKHTGMKAKCINSPPILLLCCDRLSNMQAHFLCQGLDEGSQERTL